MVMSSLVSISSASPLIIQMRNVPYDANLSLLCEQTVLIYYTTRPTNLVSYCNANLTKKMNHLEIVEVNLVNVTSWNVNLDAYPTALNTALTNKGFFDLWPNGEVTIVANQIRLLQEVNTSA